MGVKTLLKHVKQACHFATIEEFRNKSLAVDASCFIYKALYAGCPPEIYMRQLLKLLKRNGSTTYLVFDGKAPHEKRATLESRHKNTNKRLSNIDTE